MKTPILKLGLGVGGLVAFPFLYLSSKVLARTAEEELADDARPPVLYLRSFAADSDEVLGRWLRTAAAAFAVKDVQGPGSDEERLAAMFREIGPPIAIGRPGERLPTLGFSRTYVTDADWQETVAELSRGAALTVLRLGDSDGLWWELRRAADTLDPQRFLLYLNAPGRADGKIYDGFRSRADEILPRPLPLDPGDARFIGFDSDWHPVLMSTLQLYTDRRPPVLYLGPADAAGDAEALEDAEALAEVFDAIGPVVAIGGCAEALPGRSAGRLLVPEEDWSDTVSRLSAHSRPPVVADLSQLDRPVVLRVSQTESFQKVFARALRIVEPRRLLLFVPGRTRRQRQVRYDWFRRSLDGSAATGLPARIGRTRFIAFDWSGRPIVPRSGIGPLRWLRLMASCDRAAIRTRAPALRPLFARHGAAPPGRRVARRVWVAAAAVVVAALFAFAITTEERAAQPLDVRAGITETWEGFAWGTHADAMRLAFRGMGDPPSDAQQALVPSGAERSFGGMRMDMAFLFARDRLVGASLILPADSAADIRPVHAALSEWLGTPTNDENGPVWRQSVVTARIRPYGNEAGRHMISILHLAALRDALLPRATGPRP